MLEAIVTIVLGAVGYLLATFWFRPVLRYLDTKHAVAMHLVLHANATPGSMATPNLIADAQQQRADSR